MSSKRRGIGDVAWDVTWGAFCAVVLARSISGDWVEAIRWVLLGLIVVTVGDALVEWRDVFPRWIAERRKRTDDR